MHAQAKSCHQKRLGCGRRVYSCIHRPRSAPASDCSVHGTLLLELQQSRRRSKLSGSAARLRTITFMCAGIHLAPAVSARALGAWSGSWVSMRKW